MKVEGCPCRRNLARALQINYVVFSTLILNSPQNFCHSPFVSNICVNSRAPSLSLSSVVLHFISTCHFRVTEPCESAFRRPESLSGDIWTSLKMASAGPANPDQVAIKVKTLINNQLKQILKKEGLPVSGAKAALQSRITERESSFDGLVPTCL